MYGFYNLWDKFKKYGGFSPKELKNLVLVILILGFVVGFNDGRSEFEIIPWLFNLFNCILIVALSVFVRETVRRAHALHFGHKVEFKIWVFGLGFSLVAAVVSMGKIPILVYGGMLASILPAHRLGYFRYRLSYHDLAGVSFLTNFSSLVLAVFFKIFTFLPNPLIQKAMVINLLFACTNMLPIPPMDGANIFYAHRVGYIFALVLILTSSALLYFGSLLAALIAAPLIAVIVGVLYAWKFET